MWVIEFIRPRHTPTSECTILCSEELAFVRKCICMGLSVRAVSKSCAFRHTAVLQIVSAMSGWKLCVHGKGATALKLDKNGEVTQSVISEDKSMSHDCDFMGLDILLDLTPVMFRMTKHASEFMHQTLNESEERPSAQNKQLTS